LTHTVVCVSYKYVRYDIMHLVSFGI